MKVEISEDNKIVCEFKDDEEKELLFFLIRRHIELMPKVYRKRNANWVIVKKLTLHGCGVSCEICKELSVDSYSYKWEKTKS